MRVELSAPAAAELADGHARYESERTGLGHDFVLEMQALAAEVAERPLTFPVYPRTKARRAFGRRFPYMLVFFVVADVVRIVCVAHQHRKPGYWRGRT